MAKLYSVALSKLIEDLKLETVYMPRDPQEIMIKTVDINRPGLQLCGFYDYFDSNRIQLFGLGEFAYMEKYTPEERQQFLDQFFSQKVPAVIISRDLDIPEEMVTAANTYEVPLLRTSLPTCDFMATMIATLKVDLAPRITRHGVLVEVYGEGILLLGESGVGKSETAIELIKRGHRLIADDAVEIRQVSNKTLVGSSPDNIRHFMELRGVGIINARRIFGMGSVKMTEKMDMVISLEQWDKTKVYDRMGMDQRVHRDYGHQGAVADHPGQDRPKPGRHHRGRLDEQPPEKDGLQRRPGAAAPARHDRGPAARDGEEGRRRSVLMQQRR